MRADLKAEIYDLDATLEKVLRRMHQDQRISQSNKRSIVELVEDGESRGVTKARLILYVCNLRRLAVLTEADFRAFTVEDAKQLLKSLEAFRIKSEGKERGYSDWTKVTSKKVFKMLMRLFKRPPEVYSWIKVGHPPVTLTKEDLLTPEEIRKIIAASTSNMWRTLISLLAEAGCRPGEALNCTVGSVIVNSDHIKIYVRGKMAKEGDRPLFLFKTYDLMKAWLAEHPQKNNPDAPLWIGKHGEPVSLHTLNRTFHRQGRNAGISKRAFPYLLRHCRATEAYGMYHTHLAQKMLGHKDLETSRVYVHLNEEDILDAQREENGQKSKKSEPKEENPELCRAMIGGEACSHMNPYGSIQCNKCKAPLGAAGAIKFEHEKEAEMEKLKELKELLVDPQVISILKSLRKPEQTSNEDN